MDDDFQALENELKAMRPAPVSPRLVARVAGELAATPAASVRRATARWRWAAAALPIAAAAAIVFFVRAPQHPAAEAAGPAGALGQATATNAVDRGPAVSSPAALVPVAAENVLYAARDEGLVTLDDGTPARRERLNYVDTITWQNPRTHASLKWSVPREEVRVVPVAFH